MDWTPKYCVIMIEPALPGENLTVSEQINEIFGPFDTDKEADEWVARMQPLINNRYYVIMPVSNPSVVNKIDPLVG